MKKIIAGVLINAFFLGLNAQNFTGKIAYKNHYTSKVAKLTSAQMDALLGTVLECFYKDGNYKYSNNGESIVFQLYNNKTNRIYNRLSNSDTLYWMDASINKDAVLSFEIIKNKEVVFGLNCDALILKTKNGVKTFYYNSKYKMDPELYKNHNYGDWYFFISKSKALPLKIVIENKHFKMESTVIEIKSLHLESNYFDVPQNASVKKDIDSSSVSDPLNNIF